MFKVAEHASGIQNSKNFLVERALAFVHQVMDGEAGNHRVERTKRGQG